MTLSICTAHPPKYLTPKVRLISDTTSKVDWTDKVIHDWAIEGEPKDVIEILEKNNLQNGFLGHKRIK